jgi:hypothetical protein
MSNRFLKLMMTEDSDFLQENYPNAFLLLIHICKIARRTPNGLDGLKVGDAIVGEITTPKKAGITKKEYRTALKKLEELRFIEVVFNPLTRFKSIKISGKTTNVQKRATKKATKSKIVNVLDSRICDINPDIKGEQKGELGATKGRQTRKKKNEQEDHHPLPSSFSVGGMGDDSDEDDEPLGNGQGGQPSEELIEVFEGVTLTKAVLDECIAIKGSFEEVQQAVEFIQHSKQRREEIVDWPNALRNWKVKSNLNRRISENERSGQIIIDRFPDYKSGKGYRCVKHYDEHKDQFGIKFEPSSRYVEEYFVTFIDPKFKEKVTNFIRSKGMQEGIITS